jgi:protocatechuate 3,4-dioxygenase alpha subunit
LSLQRTPSQTVGPYLAIAMRWADGPFVVPEGTEGAFWIRGSVIDGAGAPIDDAVVETWQADPSGRFATGPDPDGFRGYGRSTTDRQGRWEIHTVKPGRVAGGDGAAQAPHVDVAIFARGLLKPVWTRIYFGDEPDANAADGVLARIDPDRRGTLVADAEGDGYRHDFRLQGERETVFFDV